MHPASPAAPGSPTGPFSPPAAPPQGWPQPGPGPQPAQQRPHSGQPFPPAPPNYQPAPGAGSSNSLPTLAGVAAVILVAVGLSIPFDATNAWSTQTAWSIFAIVTAMLALAPALLRNSFSSPRTAFFVGAAGTTGLIGYWLLIALPQVSSNQGFVLTLGAALAGLGCWFSPLRPR